MNSLSNSISILTLQQPRMRKGSFATLIGAMPLLDVFVAGPENRMAVDSLSPDGIADLVGRSPMLIYGPSGAGKTSLALTIAARWMNETTDRNLTLTSGSDFSRAFTRAIEADDMDRFRQLHRQCDCLLVDNIHELATKPAAQEEMIATLDWLTGEGLAIILTSTELPSLIPNLRPALTSRLNGGFSVPVVYPGLACRKEILRLLASNAQIAIEESELDAIGSQSHDNMSAMQLRGILIRWSHHNRIVPDRTPLESKRLIDSLLDSQMAKAPSVSEIAKMVGRELQLTMDLLRGPGRKSSIVRARGLAMFLTRQLTDESFQNIGAYFGGRDHTTVMHACKKTEEDLASDHELTRVADRVRQRFKN